MTLLAQRRAAVVDGVLLEAGYLHLVPSTA
jgi:hypothetical protein